jgi:hypothetical protein
MSARLSTGLPRCSGVTAACWAAPIVAIGEVIVGEEDNRDPKRES